MAKLPTIVLASALLAFPVGTAAQLGFAGAEVSAGFAGWSGDDLGDFGAGPRFKASIYTPAGPTLSVGLTGAYGRGDITDLDKTYEELGIGATLRRAFDTEGPLGFYGSLFAGWSRLSVDLAPENPRIQENGFAIGPALGVELALGGGRTRLTAGGELLWHSMGDIRLSSGAPSFAEGGDKGWHFGGTIGLFFGP
jgi:hypothetical protein